MAETKMRLVDWLDDLCVRFIINLPQEELESVERICFQVEEAHWFYEDFIRPLDSSLPSMNLKHFCLLIFQHCPLFSEFSQSHHSAAYSEFLAYKTRVPVRGAIMLNDAMDQVVLVKGWKKGARWSFPRGKINKDENDLDCAVREVYEETGFDARVAGLVGEESGMKSIEVSMREQHMRLYVFRGVPMDTYFEPRTRKEISKISWYKLSELPTLKRQKQQQGTGEHTFKENMFYMVAPFLGPLKNWIKQQQKIARRAAAQAAQTATEAEGDEEDLPAEESAAEGANQPEVTPDDHIKRLLAGLRHPNPVPDNTNLPEVSSPPEAVPDVAAELKRLLSVSEQGAVLTAAFNNTPTIAPPNTLLSMLQGNAGQSVRPPGIAGMPPRTPFDQINPTPAEPDTPHHQHPRPPQFSTMPPPPTFPFSPAHQTHTQPMNMYRQQQNNGYPAGPMSSMPPPPLPGFRHHPPQNVATWQQQPQHFPPQNRPLPHAYSQHLNPAPRPYHRTGDPEFAQGAQSSSTSQEPAIPPASKLPPPKLTPHAIGLLNAFKSGQSGRQPPSPQPAIKPFTAAAEIYKQTRPQDNASPLPVHVPSQAPEVAAVQSTSDDRFSGAQPPPEPTVPKPRNPQQDTLLNLFMRPPEPSPTLVPQQTSAQNLAPEPVELSAQSPSLERQQPVKSSSQEGYNPAVPASNVVGQTKQNKAGLTSATVSGPLNAPNFEKLRKQAKPAELNGRSSPKTQTKLKMKKPEQPVAQQFSILTRPRPETSATPSPKQVAAVPSHRSHTNSPMRTIDAPKPFAPPFTPQILRRPQGGTASPTPRIPTQTFDRRESMPNEQKSTLLSLFGMPQTTSPPVLGAAGILSPVSPLPEKQLQLGSGDRSRISSITSVVGDGPMSSRSARESMSGASTTPADRSFLLGYLKGVVKEAGK